MVNIISSPTSMKVAISNIVDTYAIGIGSPSIYFVTVGYRWARYKAHT